MKRISFFSVFVCLFLITACIPFFNEDTSDEAVTTYAEETSLPDLSTEEKDINEMESQPENVTITDNSIPYGDLAYIHLLAIADGIGYREPGSDEEGQTKSYIENSFRDIGFIPIVQNFSAYDPEKEETITSSNVIAVKEGESEEIIVVGAHYDSAYEESSSGADDNASGVAVMLEAADLVFKKDTPYTIYFIAFGSEELGLNGSTWYVDQLTGSDLVKIHGMVNLDSLIAGDKLYVYGNDGAGSMRDWVLADANNQGVSIEGRTEKELFNPDGSPCECADFDAFEKSEIPYVYFEATNWDLSPDAMIQVDPQYGKDGEIRHTNYDHVAYINDTFPGRIEDHLGSYCLLLFDLLTNYE